MSAEPSEKRSKVPTKLGYWKIRGVSQMYMLESVMSGHIMWSQLAQPIRLLLKYTETEFEDVTYEKGEDWFSIKFTLGLEFPNVSFVSLCIVV